MSVIRWEDPPASKGMAVHDWPAIGAQLVAAPGKWALVAVCANGATAGSTARHIRDGKYDPLAVLGLFEARSRTVGGEHRVYARYVGGAGSEATPNDLPVGPGSTSPEPGPTVEIQIEGNWKGVTEFLKSGALNLDVPPAEPTKGGTDG